ncbi:MAG: Hsp70 family protein, partial [Verrucomicrobiota bacterium]|nr:Hsp70 family protein [Verrucomicrobiota bacterium]
MKVPEKILGIDLGTTNSLVGVVDSGFPILFADKNGSRITPSVVSYSPDDAPIVGEAAKRMLSISPESTIASVKRKMGSKESYHIHGKSMTPEQVSADILIHLRNVAEEASGENFSKAVITVPAYFNDAQRTSTKRAAEIAGLEVVRIISEPTAAAIAYGLDKMGDKSRIAVYDLGGGTFDVSILELSDGVFQVLSTSGDTELGGDDVDAVLADFIYHKAENKKLSEASVEVKILFSNAARRCKEALSLAKEYELKIPFYDGQKSFEMLFGLDLFNQLVTPLIEKTVKHCQKALMDSGLEKKDLDSIILVGGSSRILKVHDLVEQFFEKSPDLSQNPDESVAVGAVIQAGVLSGALKEVILLDVTPLSLGVETFGGLMNVIIPRNTTIPVKRGELFTNAVANQRSMSINVLQGEREMATDNWKLGEFEIEFDSSSRGEARVGVEFSLDADGILTVLARDTFTGNEKVISINSSAVDVEDERVEKMVNESIEFAFDDMNQRIFAEAKLKSDELLPAVDN